LEANLETKSRYISEIFASKMSSYFGAAGPSLAPGWNESTIGEVTHLVTRGISPSYTDDEDTLVLNQRCIRNHELDLQFARYHNSVSKSVNSDKYLVDGDILVNSTGVGTLGRVAQYDALIHPKNATVDSHVSILRPNFHLICPELFKFIAISCEEIFVELSTGSGGQTELNREAIRNVRITYPTDLAIQKSIAATLEELKESLVEVSLNQTQARTYASALRQSILSSVFTEKSDAA
jgi:type I restriction enzyme S subunit